MHKKHSLLCTAACALFFSYFNATYTSNASGLSAHTRHTLEEIIKLPEQYRHAIDLINTPTQEEKNLEMIASGGMMEGNSHFDEELKRGLSEIKNSINRQFLGSGLYGSSTHTNEFNKGLNDEFSRIKYEQSYRDLPYMLQANAYLGHLQQNRLKMTEDLLKGYEKALSDAAQAAAILEADNQQRVNDAHRQWVMQNNQEWHKLQNKAEILHKAAEIDQALQGHNTELSDTIRTALIDTWNADTIKNAEKKGEASLPSLPSKEKKPSLIDHNGNKEGFINEFSSANAPQKGKDNTSSKTTLTSSPDHVSLPTKVASASQTSANTESAFQLAEVKETAALSHDVPNPEETTEALTPQQANYLAMPHALFSIGFADVNNQNTLLDNVRITMFEAKDHKEQGVFFSTYAKKSILYSSSQTPQKSASTDIRYAALQAGLTLIALEEQNTSTDFGFLGTYGKLAFTPKKKEEVQKNILDKWSLTAYGHMQHDSGVYASAFLSYGILKGENTTALIKNTKTLAASATLGKKLPNIVEGIILEPQAQFVYQRLMLGVLSDTESFKMNMGHPSQWLLCIGGRLTQNKGGAVSFYGKVNIINSFGNNNTVQIDKNSFQLSPTGTSLEGGLGIHAHLSQNIALHGDVSYQRKLKEASETGISVSAGMRYRF
ncbi:autotransporter outer membrane beta-barrel domain-containing protein [Bartonella raoultii]|uniref:autotransporter outer membrane beta-barrel domain-containing protein n=1 Tax=Bartonella raoultii TaxID=1457020 RepID=UPI001ABA483E|nr:autotransporter outer membrane beta-barrel domain-containing protein [Bartonella raoultii]